MILYIISAILSLYLWISFFLKFRIKKESIGEKDFNYNTIYIYKPHGLKIYYLLIIIFLAFFPIINIIMVVAWIVVLKILHKEELSNRFISEYYDIFILRMWDKIYKFLNKTI